MNTHNNLYGYSFSPSVIKDLKELYNKIEEEEKKEAPDNEKIVKLKQEHLLRGMQINTSYINNYRRNIPW